MKPTTKLYPHWCWITSHPGGSPSNCEVYPRGCGVTRTTEATQGDVRISGIDVVNLEILYPLQQPRYENKIVPVLLEECDADRLT